MKKKEIKQLLSIPPKVIKCPAGIDTNYYYYLSLSSPPFSTNCRPDRTRTTSAPKPDVSFISVRVNPPRTRFAIGSRLSVPCVVNSFVAPTVFWRKNGQKIRPDRRVQVRRVFWGGRGVGMS